MKGQEIKSRLRSMERDVEDLYQVKPPRRTWIVSANGQSEEEIEAEIEKRISKIKAGKIKHPIDGQAHKDKDEFMSIKIFDIEGRDIPKMDVEKVLYDMAQRRTRPPDSGDNGGPPEITEDEEIEDLERQIKELESMLEEEGE